MKIERSDRRLLIWAGAFMLLLILALTFFSQDEEESGIPSTYSAQRGGAKAAFLLLQRWLPRIADARNRARVGATAAVALGVFGTLDQLPAGLSDPWQKRQYFDTRAFGKSAAGHEFPNELTENEKRELLEYLKTL